MNRELPSEAFNRSRLITAFRWVSDRTDPYRYADVTGWWRDPAVLGTIGGALAALFQDRDANVVIGPQSRGSLLGALTAASLGLGFAEVRKEPPQSADSDAWWVVSTSPDYRDRHLTLGLPRSHLRSGDRALFVDDWIDTGAQASACRQLVQMSGASWVGAATVVDALQDSALRRRLDVRSLLHIRDL